MIAICALILGLQGNADSAQEPELPEPPPSAEAQEQQALPDGEARLIDLAELAGLPAELEVTVLFHCKQADAVTASRSVMQSFSNPRAVKMQSDGRANAIFLSGSVALVQEAVARLEALDEIEPKPLVRSTPGNRSPAEGPLEVIEDYNNGAVAAKSGVGFLIAGMIGLSLVALLVARRFVR